MFVQFDRRIGGRSFVNSATLNTAVAADGFATTRNVCSPRTVDPSGANQVGPASPHDSAATPESSPPARAVQPATTRLPNHSTTVAASRWTEGTRTPDTVPAGTILERRGFGALGPSPVRRTVACDVPGLARNTVVVHPRPPPWGQTDQPDDALPGGAAGSARGPALWSPTPPAITAARTRVTARPRPMPLTEPPVSA